MPVTVRLFARLRDLAGSGELSRELPPDATVGVLWSALVQDYPAFGAYEKSISTAVNAEYSKFSTAVAEGDEIAFMPPVSGG